MAGRLIKVFFQQLLGDAAGNQKRVVQLDLIIAKRQDLIQNTQCVTHATLSSIGNYPERVIFIVNVLLIQDILHALKSILSRDPPKIKPLYPTDNSQRNLMRFGGCQDKNHIGGRFFQGFQKSIERPS